MAVITVDNLVNEVRDQTDEFSTFNVTDDDIIQALNRGQRRGVNILCRHYPDPYMKLATLALSSSSNSYDIPEDAFEDRIESFYIWDGSTAWPVLRIPYRRVADHETASSSARPNVYTIVGRTISFYPRPSGTYDARMWYVQSPQPLVKPQGRIEYVDTVNNQLHVDSIGSDLTTTTDALGSYVNVINAHTGEVRSTLQIKTIDGNEITFKSVESGRRSAIYNQDIDYTISSEIEVDDYLCLASGTCVPYFAEGMASFLVQYAVAEIRRRLEDNPDIERQVLAEFEQTVERQWAGRELKTRVVRRSTHMSRRRFNRMYPRGR